MRIRSGKVDNLRLENLVIEEGVNRSRMEWVEKSGWSD